MGLRLKYRDIAAITPIKSGEMPLLAQNITIAPGDTKTEKRENALKILNDNSKINAVVIIEPPRPEIKSLVNLFDNMAAGYKIRAQIAYENNDAIKTKGISERFVQYINGRDANLKIEPLKKYNKSNTSPIANFWKNYIADYNEINSVKLVRSTVSYYPEYTTNLLNIHVHADNNIMDYREIECNEGSGTLIFDNNDFKIHFAESSRNGAKIEAVRAQINAWALVPGSSVIIRSPSIKNYDMSSLACIHASGIGGQERPEQRLTVKNDLYIA